MKIKDKIVTFSIIGCGAIAQRHAQHIYRIGRLVSVCDINKEKADFLAQKYKANAYYNIKSLLAADKQADVVSICTPNGLHAEHAIQALRTGHHVLCEKPMAIKVKDCQKMIVEAKKARKQLFVVKQNRFNPPVAAVKKLLDAGKLGTIFGVQVNCFWNRNKNFYEQTNWRGTKNMDGGVLFTQFSHFIDLLYWMFGNVNEVKAYIANYNHPYTQIDDHGGAILKFDNGAIGTFHFTINAHQKNMEGSITIFGGKGTVKIGGQYLNELEYQSIDNCKITNLPRGNKANNYGFYQGSMSNHDKIYENLRDILLGRKGEIADGNDGLKTVEIIAKMYKQANKTRRA